MPVYNKPGVYVEDKPYANAPIAVASGPSTAAFIGVTDRGPTETVSGAVYGVPTLVTSWSDFLNKFGTGGNGNPWATASELKYAVKSFFDNLAGGQAWVVRAVKTNATKGSATAVDRNGTITTVATSTTTVIKAPSLPIISIGFSVAPAGYPVVGSRITVGDTLPTFTFGGKTQNEFFNGGANVAGTADINKFIVRAVYEDVTAITSAVFTASSDVVNNTSVRINKSAHGLTSSDIGRLVTISGVSGAQSGNYLKTSQILSIEDANNFRVALETCSTNDTVVSNSVTVTPVRTIALSYNDTTSSIFPASSSGGGTTIKGLVASSGLTTNSADTLAITAKDEGTWSQGLWYTITPSGLDGRFDLTIYSSADATSSAKVLEGGWVERFSDLTMDATDTVNYAITKVSSNYVTLSNANSNATGWYDLPVETGTWSTAATDYVSSVSTGSGYVPSKFTPVAVKLAVPTIQPLGSRSPQFTTSAGSDITASVAGSVTSSTYTFTPTGTPNFTSIVVGTSTNNRTNIIPGLKYGASTTATKTGAVDKTFVLAINWYNSAGTIISTTSATATAAGGNDASQAVLTIAPVLPPYNAVSFAVTVTATAAATMLTTGTHTLTNFTVTSSVAGGSEGSTDASLATLFGRLATVEGPLVFNYPGQTTATAMTAILDACAARGDTFAVFDTPITNYANTGVVGTAATPATVTSTLGILNAVTSTNKKFGAAYYPAIYINDYAQSNVTKCIYPGGAVVAKMLSTDLQRGVYKAPAGLGVSITGAVAVPLISNTDFDAISANTFALNTIRQIPGAGICIMGARTLSSNPVDRYVNNRRTLMYLRKQLSDYSQFAIFEPNTQNTWTSLINRLDSFLYDFWRQGGLNGATPAQAYYIKCDADINTSTQIQNGYLLAEVGVALTRPAEFIILTIGQIDGGITVTTTA